MFLLMNENSASYDILFNIEIVMWLLKSVLFNDTNGTNGF